MKQTKVLLLFVFIIIGTHLMAQIKVPSEKRGDRKFRKEGIHNGNLVETLFYNMGEVGWWTREPSGVWPIGSNHNYTDGFTPLVIAEVPDNKGDPIRMVEADYRELMDVSPKGVERGWQPRPGYFNPNADYIAMSDKPISWPTSWPDVDESWDGYWYGYFGKRTNADQESYFVMDDNSDDAHDFYPDSTDKTRRGLGLRIDVRGFQWSNVLAEDLIFWHYDILNEGTTNFSKIIFGMYVDCGIGGTNDSNDDLASFDINNDITYSWDTDGIGQGGWSPTGYLGYAFFESPGNQYNKIDDDEDGELNSPTVANQMIIGEISGNGIDDNNNGLVDEAAINVGMKYADRIDNDGNGKIDEMIDESREDGIDNNGDWDIEIDDVGLDGISGTADFGEGDGKPTSGWQLPNVLPDVPTYPVNKYGLVNTGQSGEPHIDKTDKNESDQIGLTAFDLFNIGTGVSFFNDNSIWEKISYSHFVDQPLSGNVAFLFGSGPFILPSGSSERFSIGLVFGSDLPDIQRNKSVAQNIYNNNYNFARPPDKPKVTAVAGDKQVTLYWDDSAENSFDSFLREYDFEGYKIYKSTDPGFIDAYTITSGYGDATLFKPSAQFDIVDDVSGFFPIDYQGVKMYMGDNKGLQHSWTDRDVLNGQTYYYAVVSYDKGNSSIELLPSECTKVIVRDAAGNVTLDVNTVQVIPSSAAAGYVQPSLEDSIKHVSGFATGNVLLGVIDPNELKDKTFVLKFSDTDNPDSISYSLYSIDGLDTSLIINKSRYIQEEPLNPFFNGMNLTVKNDEIAYDDVNSGWKNKSSNLLIVGASGDYTPTEGIAQTEETEGFPSNYEIRMGVPDSSWRRSGANIAFQTATNFQIWDTYYNKKVKFFFNEPTAANKNGKIDPDERITIWRKIDGTWREVWFFDLKTPANQTAVLPDSGEIGIIKIKTPFMSGDTYTFTTVAQIIDIQKAKVDLNKVAVVPNPYIGAARWEPQRLTQTGRGERRIYFIHLPAEATIRIYTISGDHVQTLNHNSNMIDGELAWDLTSKEGLDIAPGIYVYHIEAPGVGEKIDKFAIIK
jgi:hypothetical protein